MTEMGPSDQISGSGGTVNPGELSDKNIRDLLLMRGVCGWFVAGKTSSRNETSPVINIWCRDLSHRPYARAFGSIPTKTNLFPTGEIFEG